MYYIFTYYILINFLLPITSYPDYMSYKEKKECISLALLEIQVQGAHHQSP